MQESERLLLDTVAALGVASEKRDAYTAGHQSRVTSLALGIAARLGLGKVVVEGIRAASLLHDIGKIGIPVEVLTKPGKLSAGEKMLVREHSGIGYDIVKDIQFPWPVAQIVLDHHEVLDGSGYPAGKSGDAISVETRVVTVADVADAMMSHRPYHAARELNVVVEELKAGREKKYDAGVVDACIAELQSGAYQPA